MGRTAFTKTRATRFTKSATDSTPLRAKFEVQRDEASAAIDRLRPTVQRITGVGLVGAADTTKALREFADAWDRLRQAEDLLATMDEAGIT